MSEEIRIDFKQLEDQVEKYLYEYNIVALVNAVQYVLSHFKIYFNVPQRDIVLVYRDYMLSGILLTFVLKTGIAIKVKIACDKDRQRVMGVETWYITD